MNGLVVAILDSRLPVSSNRFGQSADALLDPDNIETTVEILLVSCMQAKAPVISNLFLTSTAICHLTFTLTSHNNCNIAVVLTDHENIGVAVGISLLSGAHTEICVFEVWGSHLGLSTASIFPHLVVQCCHYSNWLAGPHTTIGVAAGISLLSCIEATISVVLNSLLVIGRHIEFFKYAYAIQY